MSCEPVPLKKNVFATLQAPIGFSKSIIFIKDSPSIQCLQIQPFTARLNFPSRYKGSGAARDKINPAADKAYTTKSKPIHDFSRNIASAANRLYVNKGSRADYQCLILSLNEWAQANSLLNVADMTGMAVRKWTLAALASNYLKLSNLHQSDTLSEYAPQRENIEKWFSAIAWQVKTDYSERLAKNVNNHDYWAAWSVLVTSVVVQETSLFHWSTSVFNRGIEHIDPQGFLPNELKRGARAAHYHNFAIAPLVAMASFMEINKGVTENQLKKLDKAVIRALETVTSTEVFFDATSITQSDPALTTRGRLAWLPIFLSIRKSSQALRIANQHNLQGNSRLGGDTKTLYEFDKNENFSGI
jgi:poly(beta-D-mannuronate) lyase